MAETATDKVLWNDRACEVRDGLLFVSRRGSHEDFDFACFDEDTAWAGKPGPEAGSVRSIQPIGANVLLIRATDGAYLLYQTDHLPTMLKV